MPQYIVPIVLFIMFLSFLFWQNNKKKHAIKNKKQDYHIELSEVIQKRYFDEYEKEQAKQHKDI